jgi:hypothetical protein
MAKVLCESTPRSSVNDGGIFEVTCSIYHERKRRQYFNPKRSQLSRNLGVICHRRHNFYIALKFLYNRAVLMSVPSTVYKLCY